MSVHRTYVIRAHDCVQAVRRKSGRREQDWLDAKSRLIMLVELNCMAYFNVPVASRYPRARQRFALLQVLAIVGVTLFVGARDGSAALRVIGVDVHERLFPDQAPQPAVARTLSVPRGAPVVFQFAVTSDTAGQATVSVGEISRDQAGTRFTGEVTLHTLRSVHVEGNTQGSKINRPAGPVPDGWMQHLVRAAPFDTLEVLNDSAGLALQPGQTNGLLLEILVPARTAPGEYRGIVTVKRGDDSAEGEFRFRVHSTVLPPTQSLHSIHWLWPEPQNLVRDNVPEWWSEGHWKLLENSARQLRRFGDDTLYTPLVNYRDPLIQIVARQDGKYDFDYARFDRWMETFGKLGYRYFAGHHILNLPLAHAGGVFALDEKTGQKRTACSTKCG